MSDDHSNATEIEMDSNGKAWRLTKREAAAWDATEIGAYEDEYIARLVSQGWWVEYVERSPIEGWSDVVLSNGRRWTKVPVKGRPG